MGYSFHFDLLTFSDPSQPPESTNIGERASVPRLGFGLGRIWVSRVSLPLSFYYSCVYLQYIVIVIFCTTTLDANFFENQAVRPRPPR